MVKIYNTFMMDAPAESIYLASQGLGKVFDRPFLGIVAQGRQTWTWFEGSEPTFESFMNQIDLSVRRLVFSYEVDVNHVSALRLPSTLSWTFCSANAQHPGQTAAWLTSRGHHVQLLSNATAHELNHVVYHSYRMDMPFIAQSFGMSLDGKIATHTGDSKYISGPEVLQAVHRLRHRYQAIMVGINTVLLDHPKLTTRLHDQVGHSPIRVILDTHLRLPLHEPLLSITEGSTIIVTKVGMDESKLHAFKNKGATIFQVPLKGDVLDLEFVFKALKQHGIHSVLVEGGATLHGAILDHGLSQRIYASISPVLIGGIDAKSPMGGRGFKTLKESLKLTFNHIETFGDDLFITATIKEKSYDKKAQH